MQSGLAAKLKKANLEREKKDDMRRELANEKAEKLRIREEAHIKAEKEAQWLRENEHLRLQMEREAWEASEKIRKTKTCVHVYLPACHVSCLCYFCTYLYLYLFLSVY